MDVSIFECQSKRQVYVLDAALDDDYVNSTRRDQTAICLKLTRDALVIPWALEELDFKLGDDFVRKFVGSIASMLAAH